MGLELCFDIFLHGICLDDFMFYYPLLCWIFSLSLSYYHRLFARSTYIGWARVLSIYIHRRIHVRSGVQKYFLVSTSWQAEIGGGSLSMCSSYWYFNYCI